VAGRTLAGPRFPDDDGSAGPQVAAALAAYAAGRGSEHAVLVALDSARLMIPVVALLIAEDTPGPARLRREKSSEMALPTVIGSDGRAALPAFTSAASLARWRPEARPVPVPAGQVWQSGAKDASAVVIDIAGPVPFAVDGARLAALAQGRQAPLPHEDPDVTALAHEVLTAEPVIGGYRLQPGAGGTDLTLLLVPVPGHGPEEVRDAAQRAGQRLMGGAGDRVRRGIQIAVAELAAGPEATGPGGTAGV
jgi:SseB protein N-terminal domain